MKKVAIMTWFHYHNFGTSLQVTALTYAIRKLGYQTDVINYIPHGKLVTLKNYKDINYYLSKIKNKIKSKIISKKYKSVSDTDRDQSFVNFLDRNVSLTEECRTSSDLFILNEKYDAFVCGSDQIWAPSLYNPKYFLDFVDNPKKMVAYAPSIGLSKIKDPYVKKRMSENISRFEYLSVREAQGAKLIKEICNKEAEVVLDPTLLLTAGQWDKMSIPINSNNQYILCYFLGTNEKNWLHAYELSKETNIPLKIIPVFSFDYKRGQDVVDGVGPGEFLSLVKNASLVCTDSFHGTAFSIIYNKPFYTYERFSRKDENNQNSRIYNILKLLDLENRLVRDKKSIPSNPLYCDYVNANVLLEIQRKKSKKYLENALNNATKDESVYGYSITNTCCGCGACSIICPTNAIDIKRDENGFLNSYIDQEKCIICKKCKTVCPFSKDRSVNIDKDIHNLYMLKSLNRKTLVTSSSGGAGYEIARALSIDGYDVVGCTYDKEKREAAHKVVKSGDLDYLNLFRGSKYLQSNSKEAFNEVLRNTNKAVIFGTPCQIAGIDLLLRTKKKRTNYVLVDLICHGVPSQHVWNKYLKQGSIKYGYGHTPDVKFRDKTMGWREMYMNIQGNNKKYTSLDVKDLFYRFFLLGHCYMSSCFECRYRTKSSADIRIGDYWGPRYKEDKEGVSMVIAITKAGDMILNKLRENNRIALEKKDCSEYWTVQYPQNPIKPVFYNELIADLRNDNKSLKYIADFYCGGFEFHKRIGRLYSVFHSMFRKGRSLSEQK